MAVDAFTVCTNKETVERLDRLANLLDRSRNYLVNQAINDFLERQAWQIEKTQ